MFICSNIKGEVLKSYAARIMEENSECSLPELIKILGVALGAKSREILVAESHSIKRKRGESVPLFGLRVRDVGNCFFSNDQERELISGTEYFQEGSLHMFYRGLRSKKFVRECHENEVKTVQEAVECIMNFVVRNISLASMDKKKDILFAKDRELMQNPHKGKVFVNSLFKLEKGELNFDGQEARECGDQRVTISDLWAVSQARSDCQECGERHPPSRKSCPANGKKCYKCRGRNHLASKCYY